MIRPDSPQKAVSRQTRLRKERELGMQKKIWSKEELNSLSRVDMTDFSLLNGAVDSSLKPGGQERRRLEVASELRERGLAACRQGDANGCGITLLQQSLAAVESLLRERQDNRVEVGVRLKSLAPKEFPFSHAFAGSSLHNKARELQLQVECDIINARLQAHQAKHPSSKEGHTSVTEAFMAMQADRDPTPKMTPIPSIPDLESMHPPPKRSSPAKVPRLALRGNEAAVGALQGSEHEAHRVPVFHAANFANSHHVAARRSYYETLDASEDLAHPPKAARPSLGVSSVQRPAPFGTDLGSTARNLQQALTNKKPSIRDALTFQNARLTIGDVQQLWRGGVYKKVAGNDVLVKDARPRTAPAPHGKGGSYRGGVDRKHDAAFSPDRPASRHGYGVHEGMGNEDGSQSASRPASRDAMRPLLREASRPPSMQGKRPSSGNEASWVAFERLAAGNIMSIEDRPAASDGAPVPGEEGPTLEAGVPRGEGGVTRPLSRGGFADYRRPLSRSGAPEDRDQVSRQSRPASSVAGSGEAIQHLTLLEENRTLMMENEALRTALRKVGQNPDYESWYSNKPRTFGGGAWVPRQLRNISYISDDPQRNAQEALDQINKEVTKRRLSPNPDKSGSRWA